MHAMHLEDMDPAQIRLLAALADTRKLSSAAATIGLSQSAASHALAKLRDQLGDALFVRAPAGLSPTPFGEHLATAARDALAVLRGGLEANPRFDPKTTTRQFTIIMSDVGQMVVLPELVGAGVSVGFLVSALCARSFMVRLLDEGGMCKPLARNYRCCPQQHPALHELPS